MPASLTRSTPYVAQIGAPIIENPPAGIAASFTGSPGDIVILSSGAVTQAATVGNNVVSTSTRIALLNDVVPSGTATGTRVNIQKFNDETTLILPHVDASGNAAAWNNNLVGTQCVLRRTSTGYGVNSAVTTNPVVEIIGVVEGQASDAAPWVRCKVLSGTRYL